MKNFKSLAAKYRHDAGSMSNADGAGQFKDTFMGQARTSNYGGAGRLSYADGGAPQGQFSKLPDTQKIYTAVLQNTKTSGAAVTCTLFGANIYGVTDDQVGGVNGTNGAYVTIAESSHKQVRGQSMSSPFWVNGLRYLTTTTAQLNGQIGTLVSNDSAGTVNSSQFRPLSYKTAAQNQSLQVDAPTLNFGVDGTTSLTLPVIANETVTIVLQIGGRFTPQNTLDSQSPLQVAAQNPLSTGTTTVIVGQ